MKKIIVLMLSIQFASIYAMYQINEREHNVLIKALNAAVNKNPNFYESKSDKDLKALIDIAHTALTSKDDLKFYEKEFQKNTQQLKARLNKIIASSTQALKDKALAQPAPQKVPLAKTAPLVPLTKAPVLASQISDTEHTILVKALNATINKNPNFYGKKSNDDLNALISISNRVLNNNYDLEFYKNEFQESIAELKGQLNKIATVSTQVLKENALAQAKKQHIQSEQKKSLPELLSNRSVIAAKALSPARQSTPAVKQSYTIYIMLDIQSFNAKGQPVYWEESINEINSKIRDGYFVPGKYHHVTLAWLESENPIPEQTINKIENALTAANEILKIVYPSGVTGISLMDGAVLLGKSHNALAFRVTESAELQKIQQIILKFISFEQVTGFKFSTFKEETPLHLTLGRIIPSRQGKRYEGIAAAMNAPSGARASQGEDLLINTYRISNPGERDRDWQELKAYAF